MASSPPLTTLAGLIDQPLADAPAATAVTSLHWSLTYAELDDRANRLANALLDAGVEHGDLVALMLPNTWRYVEMLLGVMRAGAVVVPVNVRQGAPTMRYTLEDADVRLVITHADLRSVADAAGRSTILVAEGADDYEARLAAVSSRRPDVAISEDDLAMLPYTSGSTGRPKGVRLPHGGQARHLVTAGLSAMPLRPTDRGLVAVPMFHANAQVGVMFPALAQGASMHVLDAFAPEPALDALGEGGCTFTSGVPTMYQQMLAEHEILASQDRSGVRILLVGSAPVPITLLDRLAEAFPQAAVVEGYGLTEGGPAVTCNPVNGCRKVGSIGPPLPGVEVRIVDDTDQEVPTGVVGELLVRNHGVTSGYHNLPDVTAERLSTDGWLRTRDLVRADADGYLYFVGRADDLIIISGENCYPREVETILADHPHIDQVCVVPVPDRRRGEVPVAFVTTSSSVTPEELVDWFLGHGGAPFAKPRRVIVLDSLPLTGPGKVDRALLSVRARAVET